MKPVFVRFKCFGPYIREQTVDFEKLAEHGLFLICGETGSGKTTILDAMCCALYGSCSGELRGELAAMRCKQADPKDLTEVEFIFECDGKRYRFVRKLRPVERRKADSPVSYHEEFECERISGGREPLLDNATKTRMNAKAEELIGLNLDQFRQVIILPQGKFETLLVSESKDKETILSSLFHTERWQKAVDIMSRELKERRDEISRQNQTIRDGLGALELTSVQELPEAVRRAEAAEQEAAAAETAAKAELEKTKALQLVVNDFIQLDRLEKTLAEKQQDAENDPGIRTRLDMAERAEKARRPYEAWKNAESEMKNANDRLAETAEKLRQAQEALRKAQADAQAHEAAAEERQKNAEEQQRLTAMRGSYENIRRLQQDAENTKAKLNEAKAKANACKAALRDETELFQQRMEALDTANADSQEKLQAYLAATAGHLAADLQEGQPCPVCGSTHHPLPARLAEDAVNSADVDDAQAAARKAKAAYDAQLKKRTEAETAVNKANEAFLKAQSEYAQADGALQQALQQRDPELETPEALERQIRKLQEAVRNYDEEKERLAKAQNEAAVACNTLTERFSDRKTQQENALKEYREKETAWQEALDESGLGTETQYTAMSLLVEEQQRLRNMLSEHASALKTAKDARDEQLEKVRGKERPDFEAAARMAAAAEEKHTETIRKHSVAAQNRKHLEQESGRLTALNDAIAEKLDKLSTDEEFHSALRGSTGLSIQRYVLGVRLGQVISEANRLLANIYGGRYRLHRSDERYGTGLKSGLELEVYDSESDQRRSVRTLSGGEKFLVALSLAIGLCTVVQNEQKGVNLEAMFIDEGFGSLDQSTLGDALDVLQSVQRGHGLVGIISHVALLEETIPTKIVIEKTANGSKATPVYG